MRIGTFIFSLLIFFSCSKSNDHTAGRLLKTVSTDNSDSVFTTEFGYDNNGRIISISQHKNNAQPAVTVTISYNGNEARLVSFPDVDPLYDQTTEVRLTLDAAGRMLKRIEYSYRVVKTTPGQPPSGFKYDTLLCEYDAAGLLKKTTDARCDSIIVNATYNRVTRFTSTATYTAVAGNLATYDEYVVYPIITRDGGVTTVSGGSSEYHKVYSYNKSYPNQTDFKNAAVLNEYQLSYFYYEPFLNNSYKNMPDKVTITNIDKDMNGSVIFTGNGVVDIERSYNNEGLLSSVNILSQNTPYRETKYFYGK